jgi:hypothetical protein
MKDSLQPLVLAALFASSAWLSTGHAVADELSISASTPEVTVSTRTPSRNFMRLPALDFEFRVEMRCSATLAPGALSLSVADTRISLTGEEIADSASQQVSVTIPQGQIPPVRIEDFCLADDRDPDDEEQVTIPAVLSVQGSLVCSDDSGSTITYSSTPLDVVVACQRESESPPVSID